MNIKVKEIRPLNNGRPLKAFVDVQLGNLVIRDFRRVMQDNGGRPYVKAPFQTYKNSLGEIQFRQVIDLPDEVRGQVDTAILSAFYRMKEQTHDGQSQ